MEGLEGEEENGNDEEGDDTKDQVHKSPIMFLCSCQLRPFPCCLLWRIYQMLLI